MTSRSSKPRTIRFYTLKDLDRAPLAERLSVRQREAIRVVGHVLPFRANDYVVEELIDWSLVPEDPIFQLTFPQAGMLSFEERLRVGKALAAGNREQIRREVSEIRRRLNPHPAGQLDHNVPSNGTEPVPGVQHKYHETCLVFPSTSQTCHAFCTFCFRWAQFVGVPELKFATDSEMSFIDHLRRHREISDVLLTGGDPMVMKAKLLARYLEPLLEPGFEHVQTIRLGTKMLAYWPYRVLSDEDSDELLELLERVVASGRHLAVMAHFVHPRELCTPAVRAAIERLRSIGAVIRTQGPLIRHINDDAEIWAEMWREQVRLGLVPYYMFVERDTGAKHYFEVPLARALDIYRAATRQQSGLGRTARGPVMSALPGKVAVEGVAEIGGHKCFALSFVQARNPDWCKRPFFAEFDPHATWLSDLRPAFGEREFFYEPELRAILGREHGLARAA
jgi:KamA family protein